MHLEYVEISKVMPLNVIFIFWYFFCVLLLISKLTSLELIPSYPSELYAKLGTVTIYI
jgi:hypothetical protein